MNQFKEILNQKGIALSEKQLDQFEQYYQHLIEWNNKMNLTAIVQREEVYHKHFLDSLALSDFLLDGDLTLLDVGSGAGFPSIPLKIAFPKLKVTIVDSTLKRTLFLKDLVHRLDLSDVDIVHNRIEDFDSKGSYDVVTARAVAALPVLIEWCAPFVKLQSKFIAMKGPKADEELKAAQNAMKTLGLKFSEKRSYEIQDSQRELLVFDKIKTSPNIYPRPYAKIKKSPL